MAEAEETENSQEVPRKSGKKGLLVGLILAALAGGGGFYAAFSGMLLAPKQPGGDMETAHLEEHSPLPSVVFVPLQPLVINVGTDGADRFFRFQARLEVRPDAEQDVTDMLPRLIDVLNS